MELKFSIVTVTYNSVKTIEQTIKSVLSQSYDNFEYILVDGVSTDGTLDIIKKYAESDIRIRFISEQDNGIYDAMNKGISIATGDVIALLNGDDYYEPTALEKIIKCIPDDRNYVVYGMVRMLKDEKESMVALYSHNGLPERMIMHPACFVSKAVYEKYQYDINYRSAADYDLFMKLYGDKGITFIPVYEIITNFRLGGMSSSVLGFIGANDIRYKYGYMSKRQHDIGNFGLKVKRTLMGK